MFTAVVRTLVPGAPWAYSLYPQAILVWQTASSDGDRPHETCDRVAEHRGHVMHDLPGTKGFRGTVQETLGTR